MAPSTIYFLFFVFVAIIALFCRVDADRYHGQGYIVEYECDDWDCQQNCRRVVKEHGSRLYVFWDTCRDDLEFAGHSQKMFCWSGDRGDRVVTRSWSNEYCEGRPFHEDVKSGCQWRTAPDGRSAGYVKYECHRLRYRLTAEQEKEQETGTTRLLK